MTRFSVRRLSRFVSRHPNWCLGVAFLLTVAAVLSVVDRLSIEMDMSELLPEDSEVARIRRDAVFDFGSFDFMLGVLEAREPGQQELLREAATQVAEALRDPRFIQRVTYRLDPLTFSGTPEEEASAMALLTEEDWAALERSVSEERIGMQIRHLAGLLQGPISQAQRRQRLRDPFNFARVIEERVQVKSGPLKVNLNENYFMSADGQMLLLLLWPTESSTDVAFARELDGFLRATREGLLARNPSWSDEQGPALDLQFAGAHMDTIADTRTVREDFVRTSMVSLAAVLALFLLAFRRPEALLFVAVPLVLGVAWTLGLASWYPGRLTQVTMAFGAILVGLGIDFSVHLYNRYLEEMNRGAQVREAIRVAISETGPGIIAGAMTTIIAFFGMMITSFVGFRELGLVAGMGIFCCLVAVLMTLPPLLAHAGAGPMGKFTARPMSTFGLRRFYFTVAAYPRITVVVGLVVVIFLGLHAREIGFEDDFRQLRQPSNEATALRDRIKSRFQVPSSQVIVILKNETLEGVLADNDRLYQNILAAESLYPLIAKDSLRYFAPSPETQRRALARMADYDLERVRNSIRRQAEQNRLSPAVFDPFLERQALSRIDEQGPPIDLSSLTNDERLRAFTRLSQRYITNEGGDTWRVVTRLYPPPTPDWESGIPGPFLEALSEGLTVQPEITGPTIIQQELRRIITADLAITVLVVLAAVFLYLVIYFESIGRAVLSLIPVCMALLCMLGTMHLLGMKLHYMNIIALPMIVGIGVDAGLHLLQRYYEDERRNLRAAITRTGRAVVITSMTTMLGFGSLSLAHFQGLRELGLLAIIGVLYTMFGALLVLPAVLRMLDPKITYRGGPGDDLG